MMCLKKLYRILCVGWVLCIMPDVYAMSLRAHHQWSIEVANNKLQNLNTKEKILQSHIEVEQSLIEEFTRNAQEIEKKIAKETDTVVQKYFVCQRDAWRAACAERELRLKTITMCMTDLESKIAEQQKYRILNFSLVYPGIL